MADTMGQANTKPIGPGFYWAKMIKADPNTRDGEDCLSDRWETVEVVTNSIDPSHREYLMVSVPGIEQSQSIENFEFGPQIHMPDGVPLTQRLKSILEEVAAVGGHPDLWAHTGPLAQVRSHLDSIIQYRLRNGQR